MISIRSDISLRRLNPDVYSHLETIYEKLERFTSETGPAMLGWDSETSKICCLSTRSRNAERIEKRTPHLVIGYFNSLTTFPDLQEAVQYFLCNLKPQRNTTSQTQKAS